jgi:uncharacterized GH25 family protein
VTRAHSSVVAFALAIAAGSASLGAHDFWIEPTGFMTDLGRVVGVKLRVGDEFHGDPVPRNEALIGDFVVVDANGRRQVVGRDGSDPAGLLRVTSPGLMVIGYRSRPSPVTLPADKFTQYLKEEGLESVIAARARSQTSQRDGREIFSRAAKSLVRAGAMTADSGDRALGFPIELVAERNPYQMRRGDSLPLRLTYRNAPLAGALIVAYNQRTPYHKVKARSDRDGRASFVIDEAGVWLVKAVHMVPAPASSNADWESFWASLTFEAGA